MADHLDSARLTCLGTADLANDWLNTAKWRAVGRGLFSGVSLVCDTKTLREKGADLQCQQVGTRLPTVHTDFIARRSLLPKCHTVAGTLVNMSFTPIRKMLPSICRL